VSHADEVITDVNTRRVMTRAVGDRFTIAWDYPGRTLLEIRILRSETAAATTADEGSARGQVVVYQGVTGSFRDGGLRPGLPYYYTVFARHPDGEWERWGDYSRPASPGETRQGRPGRGGVASPIALALLFLIAVTAGLVWSPAAFAEGEADGDEKAGSTQDPAAAAVASAQAVAEADPGVSVVLGGTEAVVASTVWGGTEAVPAGVTLEYRWAAADATGLDDEWPLLDSGDGTPAAPYGATIYRLRAADVSALRVDVLLDGPRIIQIMPLNGETDFALEEQTWTPFIWFPWLTQRPWVLTPVFIAIAALIIARAWRRSRAWNRRLPSMTRHDRQFIGRVAVLLFLIAGFAWQFYEGWYAANGPSVDAVGPTAGDLVSLPLLLIPPGLFVAGLVLELSAGPHRGSWGLLAVLTVAASAYYLASALTGATTNLNLSYYILLAILALIAIPRAFSAGKMGWSRNVAPRYG